MCFHLLERAVEKRTYSGRWFIPLNAINRQDRTRPTLGAQNYLWVSPVGSRAQAFQPSFIASQNAWTGKGIRSNRGGTGTSYFNVRYRCPGDGLNWCAITSAPIVCVLKAASWFAKSTNKAAIPHYLEVSIQRWGKEQCLPLCVRASPLLTSATWQQCATSPLPSTQPHLFKLPALALLLYPLTTISFFLLCCICLHQHQLLESMKYIFFSCSFQT